VLGDIRTSPTIPESSEIPTESFGYADVAAPRSRSATMTDRGRPPIAAGGNRGGDRRPRARSPEGAGETYRSPHDALISAALTSANLREAEPQNHREPLETAGRRGRPGLALQRRSELAVGPQHWRSAVMRRHSTASSQISTGFFFKARVRALSHTRGSSVFCMRAASGTCRIPVIERQPHAVGRHPTANRPSPLGSAANCIAPRTYRCRVRDNLR
jgi:hypothetical protein